jgi:hypothetical protein
MIGTKRRVVVIDVAQHLAAGAYMAFCRPHSLGLRRIRLKVHHTAKDDQQTSSS